MANFVVADSDLLIDFMNNRGTGMAAVRGWIERNTLAVTTVSVYELSSGGIDPSDPGYERILANHVLELDLAAADRAGRIAHQLRRQGQSVGAADCLIAGTCISYGLPLATRNRAHFERIEGLELVDF